MKKPASRLVHPPAERILPQRFWSSDKLTGSQTTIMTSTAKHPFWSSDKLTGSQTRALIAALDCLFWSSDKLTGSQTALPTLFAAERFGAVTN